MYIETSTGRLGDVARLLSPIFSVRTVAEITYSDTLIQPVIFAVSSDVLVVMR